MGQVLEVRYIPNGSAETEYLRKGAQIYIKGQLYTSSREDNSSVVRYFTEILVKTMGTMQMPGRSASVQPQPEEMQQFSAQLQS